MGNLAFFVDHRFRPNTATSGRWSEATLKAVAGSDTTELAPPKSPSGDPPGGGGQAAWPPGGLGTNRRIERAAPDGASPGRPRMLETSEDGRIIVAEGCSEGFQEDVR